MEDETTRRLPTKEEHRDPFFVLCLISHYYANKIYWRIIEGDRRAVASTRRRGGTVRGGRRFHLLKEQRSWIQPRFSSSVIRDRFPQSSTIKHHPVWENEAYRSSELDSQSDPDSIKYRRRLRTWKKVTVCTRITGLILWR